MFEFSRQISIIMDLIEKEINELYSQSFHVQSWMRPNILPDKSDSNPQISTVTSAVANHLKEQQSANVQLLMELEKLTSCVQQTSSTTIFSENEMASANSRLQGVCESLRAMQLLVNRGNTQIIKICDSNSQIGKASGHPDHPNNADIRDIQKVILSEIDTFKKKSASFIEREVSNKFIEERASLVQRVETCSVNANSYFTQALRGLEEVRATAEANSGGLGSSEYEVVAHKLEMFQRTLRNMEDSYNSMETQVFLLKDAVDDSRIKVEAALLSNPQNIQKQTSELNRQKAKFLALKQEVNDAPITKMVLNLPKKVNNMRLEIRKCMEEMEELIEKKSFNSDHKIILESVHQLTNSRLAPLEAKLEELKSNYAEELERCRSQVKDTSKNYKTIKATMNSRELNIKKVSASFDKLDALIEEKLRKLVDDQAENPQDIKAQINLLGALHEGVSAYEKDKKAVETVIAEIEKKILLEHEKFVSIEQLVAKQEAAQSEAKRQLENTYSKLSDGMQDRLSSEQSWLAKAKARYDEFTRKIERYEKEINTEETEKGDDMTKKYIKLMSSELKKFDGKQRGIIAYSESLGFQVSALSRKAYTSLTITDNGTVVDAADIVTEMAMKAKESIMKKSADLVVRQEEAIQKMNDMCTQYEAEVRAGITQKTCLLIGKYMKTFREMEDQCDTTLTQLEELIRHGAQSRADISEQLELFGTHHLSLCEKYEKEHIINIATTAQKNQNLSDITMALRILESEIEDLSDDCSGILLSQEKINARIHLLEAKINDPTDIDLLAVNKVAEAKLASITDSQILDIPELTKGKSPSAPSPNHSSKVDLENIVSNLSRANLSDSVSEEPLKNSNEVLDYAQGKDMAEEYEKGNPRYESDQLEDGGTFSSSSKNTDAYSDSDSEKTIGKKGLLDEQEDSERRARQTIKSERWRADIDTLHKAPQEVVTYGSVRSPTVISVMRSPAEQGIKAPGGSALSGGKDSAESTK